MPDVKYVFTAEDRTAATISKIRRRIDSLAGRGAKVQVSVEADGLERTKREIEDLPDSVSVRLDSVAGSVVKPEDLAPSAAEMPTMKVDSVAGDIVKGGVLVPSVPDAKVDSVAGDVVKGTALVPYVPDVKVDSVAGVVVKGSALVPYVPDVKVDSVAGDIVKGGVLVPSVPDVKVDSVAGDVVKGTALVPYVPDVKVDSVAGVVVKGSALVPYVPDVKVDSVAGDIVKGGVLVPSVPDAKVDSVAGDVVIGTALVPYVPDVKVDSVAGDIVKGGVLVPSVPDVKVDSVAGDIVKGTALVPYVPDVKVDSVAGVVVKGGVLVPKVPDAKVDSVAGDVVKGSALVPYVPDVKVDSVAGVVVKSTALVPYVPDVKVDSVVGIVVKGSALVPNVPDVKVDSVVGIVVKGSALVPNVPDVKVDSVVGIVVKGSALVPNVPDAKVNSVKGEIVEGTVLVPKVPDAKVDSVAGVVVKGTALVPTVPDVKVDSIAGSIVKAEDLAPASPIEVKVNAVAGSTVDAGSMATPGGAAGGGDTSGILPGAVTRAAVGLMTVEAMRRVFLAAQDAWMTEEQALTDVEKLFYLQQNRRFTDEEREGTLGSAQAISKEFDLSTPEALGVVYIAMQQGRPLEQVAEGGMALSFVEIAQATKGFGQSTLDVLPSVITAGTDMLDIMLAKGMGLDEALESIQKVMVGYTAGGKGDITNFGKARGQYAALSLMQGWSEEEAVAFMLSGMGGADRPTVAATGMRNILRDISQTGRKTSKYEVWKGLGFVREGSEQYDDGGKLESYENTLFDQKTGRILPPQELIAALQTMQDPEVFDNPRFTEFFTKAFTVEAQTIVNFLMLSDAVKKYADSLKLVENADVAGAADVARDTAQNQSEVIAGRFHDAWSQVFQMVGGPAVTALWQEGANTVFDGIGRTYDADKIFDKLGLLNTPELFGYWDDLDMVQRPKHARAPQPTVENYRLDLPLSQFEAWLKSNPMEAIEQLAALIEGASAYLQRPSGWEAAWGLPGGEQPAAPSFAAPDEYGFSLGLSGTGAGWGAYTVVAGDTLGEIATTQGVNLAELIEANPEIPDPNLIDVGQKLNMPGSELPALMSVGTPYHGIEKSMEEFMYSQRFATPDDYAFSLGVNGPDAPLPPLAAEGIAVFVALLTGLLEPLAGGGLPLDTSALEAVGVKAKVTELDTSAVEDQVIKLAADVVINVTGGAIGPRFGGVQQDDGVEQGNRVNAATTAAGRQRSGGETFDDFVASR